MASILWCHRTSIVVVGLLGLALAAACASDRTDRGLDGVGGGGDGDGGANGGSGDDSGGGDDGGGDGGGGDGDSDDGPIFDVGTEGPGGNPGDCPGGGAGEGEIEFSYIWIANSDEGTVSKIDTFTGTELGRYVSGPESESQPSRTSVNLFGDAAVANRGPTEGGGQGSVTKIAARSESCPDKNGNGAVDTSSGPGDVLAWGEDECVLWNHEIPSDDYKHGPRPLAWEGSTDEDGCASLNPRLWCGWYDFTNNAGRFRRLDGTTGESLDDVTVPDWTGLEYGPYGGAVDADGNFWASGWQAGHLVRIDAETLDVDVHPFPSPPSGEKWSYGMALDQYGNPWIAGSEHGIVQFDVQSGQWNWVALSLYSTRGIMVDREDRAWVAVDMDMFLFPSCGLAVVDVETKQPIVPLVDIPGCGEPVGVSIDIEGYPWIVDKRADRAFKIDPDTYEVVLTADGLVAPYTYSDMTGAGLKLVTYPPQG